MVDYKTPPGPGVGPLVDRVRRLEAQLRDLQRAKIRTGAGVDAAWVNSQISSAVANFLTQAQIQNLIDVSIAAAGGGGGGTLVYVQPDEPLGVPIGTLWYDTDGYYGE